MKNTKPKPTTKEIMIAVIALWIPSFIPLVIISAIKAPIETLITKPKIINAIVLILCTSLLFVVISISYKRKYVNNKLQKIQKIFVFLIIGRKSKFKFIFKKPVDV
jgi:hypothetical protein